MVFAGSLIKVAEAICEPRDVWRISSLISEGNQHKAEEDIVERIAHLYFTGGMSYQKAIEYHLQLGISAAGLLLVCEDKLRALHERKPC